MLLQRGREYDAIVVGARVAGAATAMLLAREGWRVLVLDRSSYGADTLSTHALMRGGVVQLHRWGVLDDVRRAATPPLRRTRFHYGDAIVDLEIREQHGTDALYAPRRTVLDAVLVDAARAAGATFAYGARAETVLRDTGGRVTGVRAQDDAAYALDVTAGVVIGADGMRSKVAREVAAPFERMTSTSAAYIYGYFAGVDTGAYDWYYRPGVSAGVIPTNGGLANVFVAMPAARFAMEARTQDVETLFHRVVAEVDGDLAARLASAERAGRFRSFRGHEGFLRRAHGPGWALVGDAGFSNDPCTAHGISDALRDAELLARSLVDTGDAAAYQVARDALAHPLLTVSSAIAAHDWTLTELAALHQELKVVFDAEVELLADLDRAGASAR